VKEENCVDKDGYLKTKSILIKISRMKLNNYVEADGYVEQDYRPIQLVA
jgi:hypothetical protein